MVLNSLFGIAYLFGAAPVIVVFSTIAKLRISISHPFLTIAWVRESSTCQKANCQRYSYNFGYSAPHTQYS